VPREDQGAYRPADQVDEDEEGDDQEGWKGETPNVGGSGVNPKGVGVRSLFQCLQA